MENHNPWVSIWTCPRATIAQIVAENPNRSLWLLAWIYGFCSLMNMYQSMALGAVYSTLTICAAAIILGALWGWINFSLWSLVAYWTGKWLKGQAPYQHVRACYAWSCVPFILNVPLWGLMVVLFGNQVFLNFPDATLISDSMIFLLFCIMIVKVIVSIWSLVIYLNALAEVQQFSVLRALSSVFLAAVIFSAVFYITWSLLIYTLSGNAVAAMLFWKI